MCDRKDNNCNGGMDEGCCEIGNMSVLPSTVAPKNTGSNTSATVYLGLTKSSLPKGCTVDLSVSAVYGSGGHAHDGGRLIGTLEKKNFTILGTEKTLTYTSGEVSGTEKINAIVEETGSAAETQITVRVEGLTPFPSSGKYHIVVRDGTATHPEGTYGTFNTVEMLKKVTKEYFGRTRRKLSVNDLSLPMGGLFDYKDTWNTPHSSHRTGTDADINRTDGGGIFTNCEDDIYLKKAISEVVFDGLPSPKLRCESGGRKHIDFD